jgi:two-component system nitrate/nitrite response regulator NarL
MRGPELLWPQEFNAEVIDTRDGYTEHRSQSADGPPRVLVVDDQALFAETLQLALYHCGWPTVDVARDSTTNGILAAVDSVSPGIVLLALDLEPAGTAMPLIPFLLQRGLCVLVLADDEHRCLVEEALSAGASDYFEKNRPFDELLRLLIDTADSLAASSVSAEATRVAPPGVSPIGRRRAALLFDRLSPRERDVLASLMSGESARAIANRRVVSLATVRTQISALLNKLEVNSQLAAVALAQAVGWRPRERHYRGSSESLTRLVAVLESTKASAENQRTSRH